MMIKFYNDNTTSAEFFVQTALEVFADLRWVDAVRIAHRIHTKGCAAWPTTSMAAAEAAVEEFTAAAADAGFPFRVEAVGAAPPPPPRPRPPAEEAAIEAAMAAVARPQTPLAAFEEFAEQAGYTQGTHPYLIARKFYLGG